MKLWKGFELEGYDKGVMTLFVKAPIVKSDVVIMYLTLNPDCKRLYLGAGRTNVIKIDDWKTLFKTCEELGVKIVNEVSLTALMNMPEYLEDVETIVRIQDNRLKNLKSSHILKLDSENEVLIKSIMDFIYTPLDKLVGDMFDGTDELLLEEEF